MDDSKEEGSTVDDSDDVDGIDVSDDVSTDELFDQLRDQRRRYVLAYLDTRSRPVHLADLATELAHAESPDAEDVTERRQRHSIRLYHADLPKLADAGLVEFDREERTAELSDDGETVAARLDLLPDVTDVSTSGSSE